MWVSRFLAATENHTRVNYRTHTAGRVESVNVVPCWHVGKRSLILLKICMSKRLLLLFYSFVLGLDCYIVLKSNRLPVSRSRSNQITFLSHDRDTTGVDVTVKLLAQTNNANFNLKNRY